MSKSIIPILIIFFFTLTSCVDTSIGDLADKDSPGANLWVIPQSEIKGDFNPFELVSQPEYIAMSEVDFLEDDELVFMYKGSSEHIYIYPRASMLVECVNEWIDDVPVAINYCPLTGSGMAWDRRIGGDTVLLTASGYLYRDNLVLYDTLTGSLWAQMLMEAVHGQYNFIPVKTLPLIQTNWAMIKENFRDVRVFQTACDSVCQIRDADPKLNDFSEYLPGELVYGVINQNGEVAAYTFADFAEQMEIKRPKNKGNATIVIGSQVHHFIMAYESSYTFSPVLDAFPVVMKDKTGSLWNIFGEAIKGSRKGEKLKAAKAYFAYANAWDRIY